MAIAVQCPECHKKYNAPDNLAGRRVKCKYCGIAFLIAADSRTSDPDFNLDDLSALSGMGDASNRAAAAAKAKATGEDDVDALFRADYAEEGAPRTNKLYIFPMSRLLDRWLPPLLLLIGLVWMVHEAFDRNDTTQLWVGFFRAAMFLLAFFAAVFPFTLMGLRAAGRKLNYEMPPNPALRVLGTFAVPFALACALWLIYGEVSGLLFGVLLGVVVALPVLFLLFRLLPVEAPVTFAYAAGSFLLSVVVAVAGFIALNLMLVGILRSLRTEYTIAVSPFGPGFKWDAPAETPQLADGREAETQPTTSESGSATQPSTNPTSATTSPSPVTAPSVNTNLVTTAPTTSPTVARANVPTGTDQAATGGTGETKPTQPMPPVGPDDAQRPPRAALVANVQDILIEGLVQQIVQPVVPGPWVAMVRGDGAGGAEDRVERWNTEKRQKDGEARVPRDPAGNHYALSPDGAYLAYLSDFPALSVQVWSFAEGRLLRPVRLARDNTAPHREQRTPILVGFSTREQVVLHWTGGGRDSILEVINVNTPPPRPRPITVVGFEHDPATFAISPDGQTFAVVTRAGDGADLESVSLTTGKPIKQMAIGELDWAPDVRVSALSYTPDGTKIAAVFQKGEGEGVLMCWPALGRSSASLFWHPLPPVQPARNGDGSSAFSGPAMQWLEGGESWLYYGAHVFDTDKGTRLGDLSTPGVRSQWTDGRDTCFLAWNDPLGEPRLDVVKLDLAKARAAAAADAADRSPGDTATSRTTPRANPK